MSGGATAALLGLLFVAVSIRVEPIARSPELRNRAAQTMALLLIGLIASVVLVIPNQAKWELGAELVTLGLVAAIVGIVLDRRAKVGATAGIGRVLDLLNATTITCVLLVASGVVLILGYGRGVYLLVPAIIAVLVGGVVNAWLILVKLND